MTKGLLEGLIKPTIEINTNIEMPSNTGDTYSIGTLYKVEGDFYNVEPGGTLIVVADTETAEKIALERKETDTEQR